MVKLTVLTNVYNEEYLMPFWLEHHRKIFDHGIVFDWGCTDRSMDIVREMCPTWEIRKVPHEKFDAELNDIMFMYAEMEFDGYKLGLNTTEFLVSPEPIRTYLTEEPNGYYPLTSHIALSTKDVQRPNTLRELFDGIEYIETGERKFRMIHSCDHGHYSLGRHERTLVVSGWIPAVILWFGEYPWNNEILKRGLQIESRVPISDYEKGIGHQHFFTVEQRIERRNRHLQMSSPLHYFPHIVSSLL